MTSSCNQTIGLKRCQLYAVIASGQRPQICDSLEALRACPIKYTGMRGCVVFAMPQRKKAFLVEFTVRLIFSIIFETATNLGTFRNYMITLNFVWLFLWTQGRDERILKAFVIKIRIALADGFFLSTIAVLMFFNPNNSFEMKLSHLFSNGLYSMQHFEQNRSLSLFERGLSVGVEGSISADVSFTMFAIDDAWSLGLIGRGSASPFIGLVLFCPPFCQLEGDSAFPDDSCREFYRMEYDRPFWELTACSAWTAVSQKQLQERSSLSWSFMKTSISR